MVYTNFSLTKAHSLFNFLLSLLPGINHYHLMWIKFLCSRKPHVFLTGFEQFVHTLFELFIVKTSAVEHCVVCARVVVKI